MKKTLKLILVATFAIGIFGMTGCQDHQERFEVPPWLGGSSIETLKEKGEFTTFLRLMEMANYTAPIEKQLFTLFVPNDASFDEYFASIGKQSVEDLTQDEAVNLFTLHVLRNPRSRTQLVYEYAWGEFQGPYQGKMGEYASLFHRKPTPSRSTPYKETVRYTPGIVGEERLIYTNDKNIPLFTEEFFHDYGAAPDGSDYEFMYPGSTWKKDYAPELTGINWHNAMVLPNPYPTEGQKPELEVRTASGFIYYLDRVVSSMQSIEEHMISNENKYGLFYDILQRFATYGSSTIDDQGRVMYRKNYDLVFNLAEERGTSTNTAVPPQNMFTAFLPNNETLQKYLDDTVLKFYSSLDSVPRVTLYYILQTQLSSQLTVASKMENGYFNAFGDPTEIKMSDLTSGFMCSNGPVYEIKRVLEPNVFTCVPGKLFIDKNYSTLLFVLNEANMLSSLANPDADVTLFATNNEDLERYGIRYNTIDARVEFRSPADGKWNSMNSRDLTYFAQDQIYQGILSDFSGDNQFVEMVSGNYVEIINGQINAGENQFLGEMGEVLKITENERNGFLNETKNPIMSRIVMGQYLTEDDDISMFTKFLKDSRLLDVRYRDPVTKEVIPNLKFLAGSDYWTAFIPTNEAMEKAIEEGIIPEKYPKDKEAKDSVNNFIMYHFIPKHVIFDDTKKDGYFDTNYNYLGEDGKTQVAAQVYITNFSKELYLRDVAENNVPLDHANANNLVRKGVIHKINTVLNHYE